MITHNKASIPILKDCNQCGRRCNSGAELERHTIKKHKGAALHGQEDPKTSRGAESLGEMMPTEEELTDEKLASILMKIGQMEDEMNITQTLMDTGKEPGPRQGNTAITVVTFLPPEETNMARENMQSLMDKYSQLFSHTQQSQGIIDESPQREGISFSPPDKTNKARENLQTLMDKYSQMFSHHQHSQESPHREGIVEATMETWTNIEEQLIDSKINNLITNLIT